MPLLQPQLCTDNMGLQCSPYSAACAWYKVVTNHMHWKNSPWSVISAPKPRFFLFSLLPEGCPKFSWGGRLWLDTGFHDQTSVLLPGGRPSESLGGTSLRDILWPTAPVLWILLDCPCTAHASSCSKLFYQSCSNCTYIICLSGKLNVIKAHDS